MSGPRAPQGRRHDPEVTPLKLEEPHNVMQQHDDSDVAHAASSVADVRPDVFAGPLLAKGERYSFTFTEVDSYPYHCAPHPDMKGTVVVTEKLKLAASLGPMERLLGHVHAGNA